MDDHTQLFVNGTDWNAKQYADVLAATDYKTAAKALQSSGYATDPDYADKIINVIETYNLEQYDVT
jgi:mannosyl-glycoprotein endo-beta-N-acetylglucosaminidase